MKKKLRILLVWAIVSLVLQFGVYAILDEKIAKVMAPPAQPQQPITRTLEATLPDTNIDNVQISYDKFYLAYKANGVFKVFNLKQNRVVFTKEPLPGSDKGMGVLNYQWLPDRDTLVYFFAKKNPNPWVTVIVEPSQSSSPLLEAGGTKSEDAQASAEHKGESSVPAKPVEPKIERRPSNPQITELYALEFPDPEETTPPDDRHNIDIEKFPAGGQIQQIVASTFTNLMYLTVQSGSGIELMEVDVMKNTRTLQRPGETISNMAASDRFGTLYVETKTGSTREIQALDGWQRSIVTKTPNMHILGDRAGKLYLAQVENDRLVKVLAGADLSQGHQNMALTTVWQGSIPYKGEHVVIGAQGEVIIYDRYVAYVIRGGDVKQVELKGEHSYISSDGAELIYLNSLGKTTQVKLEPLQAVSS